MAPPPRLARRRQHEGLHHAAPALFLLAPVVVLIPHDTVFQKTLSNQNEVESRGG